jgi:hypothetical protein
MYKVDKVMALQRDRTFTFTAMFFRKIEGLGRRGGISVNQYKDSSLPSSKKITIDKTLIKSGKFAYA